MAGISVIDDLKKGSIVKGLASKSYMDVGLEFNLDRIWPNLQTMRRNIHKMYSLIRTSTEQDQIEKYGITKEVLEILEKALSERKINAVSYDGAKKIQAKESQELLQEQDITSLAVSGRDKSAILLHKKMDMIGSKPKMLEKESIVNLAKVFATFFDKAQISTGQATEHIAVLAKMDENIDPDQAMEMLLKIRENTMSEKERKI